MGKRKLYGAAAAAHARKVARSRGGALVRRSSSAVATRRTRTRTIVVRAKRRRGGGGMGGGIIAGLKRRAPELIASSVYAWGTLAMTPTAIKVREYINKAPVLEAIGRPASHGLLALLIASNTGGKLRRGMDLLATAALHRAAQNLGITGFDHEEAAKMAGDESSYLEGELDDDLGDELGDE